MPRGRCIIHWALALLDAILYIDHSEHIFDNVKTLCRHVESLAINSVTAKLSCGRVQWHERSQKLTLGALGDVC